MLLALAATIGYGLLGFLDDIIIVIKKRSLGLKAYQKILGQIGVAVVIAVFAYNNADIGSKLIVPFFNVEWDLGGWYIPFTVFVIVSMVNSVNLTDGLDGLASGVTLIDSAAFSLIFFAMFTAAEEAGLILLSSNMMNMMIFSPR